MPAMAVRTDNFVAPHASRWTTLRTLIEDLAKIKSGDVVLAARSSSGPERLIRLRCVTTPDKAQKVLLNRLGLTLPQRLRRIDEVAQM
jgi:hypothetical protein